MTDHPTDAPRLTDRELTDAIARAETPAGSGWKRVVVALAHEVRASRSLISALKAHGCPWREETSGCSCSACGGTDTMNVCAYCGGTQHDVPGGEPRYDHVPMDDGGPCLWKRVEAL